MRKAATKKKAPKPKLTPDEIARRKRMASLRRFDRDEREIRRRTKSLHVLISRADRALREFAEFILKRDGDEVPQRELESEQEFAEATV
jgi:hypothetical protein